jgi:hypothetical protein
MKVSYIDENNILIFISDDLLNNIDFIDEEETKDYFRELFFNIKDKLKLIINGFYLVMVYQDKYYGIVIELKKEDIDFYDYYIDEIDMHITIEKDIFLYKINDIFISNDLLKDNDVIIYNNELYLKINKEIDNILKGHLLEISELIYKNTNEIIKNGKILNI